MASTYNALSVMYPAPTVTAPASHVGDISVPFTPTTSQDSAPVDPNKTGDETDFLIPVDAPGDATGQTPLDNPLTPDPALNTGRRGRQGVTRVNRAKIRIMLRSGVSVGRLCEMSGLSNKTIIAISRFYGGYKRDEDYQDEVYVDPQFLEQYPAKLATPKVITPRKQGRASRRVTPYSGPSSASVVEQTQPANTSATANTRNEVKDSASINDNPPTVTQQPAESPRAGGSISRSQSAQVENQNATQASSTTVTSGDTNEELKTWLTNLRPRDLSNLYAPLLQEGIDMSTLRYISQDKREELNDFFREIQPRLLLMDRRLLVDAVMKLKDG